MSTQTCGWQGAQRSRGAPPGEHSQRSQARVCVLTLRAGEPPFSVNRP